MTHPFHCAAVESNDRQARYRFLGSIPLKLREALQQVDGIESVSVDGEAELIVCKSAEASWGATEHGIREALCHYGERYFRNHHVRQLLGHSGFRFLGVDGTGYFVRNLAHKGYSGRVDVLVLDAERTTELLASSL